MKRFAFLCLFVAALPLIAAACGSSPTSASSGCQVITGNTTTSFPAAGGSASISISTSNTCTWGAVSNASFLSITQGASGSGNGSIGFAVAANTGPVRVATLTVTDSNASFADTAITITQSAP
jgi:hypothetical protein